MGDSKEDRPECVFVDLNIIGSSFDGIELIRKINKEYGNGFVIGIISSSDDKQEIENAKSVGAQFWIIKIEELGTESIANIAKFLVTEELYENQN